MARISWKNPPPCIVVGGDEEFLFLRELRNAVLVTQKIPRPVIWAETDSEAVDALASASTFGESCLILCPLKAVSVETVLDVKKFPPPNTCLLLHHDDALDEKKFPALGEVHAGFWVSHMRPTSKKGLKTLAIRVAKKEAEDLIGEKDSLDENLAEAIVSAVGTDLGAVAYEIQKYSAMVRFEGGKKILPEHVRKLIRPSTEVDLTQLREALKLRDEKRVLLALEKIERAAGSEAVMLLLRGKGGPADLVANWLRAGVFLKKGGTQSEVSQRLGVPDWSVPDMMIALKNWNLNSLRNLLGELAEVDLSVLKGAPNPWYSLQAKLVLACRK